MLPVVLCANAAYVNCFKVWATSFREHNPDREVILYHTGDFPEDVLKKYNVTGRIGKHLEGKSTRLDAVHLHGALLRLVAFDDLERNGEDRDILYMDLDILIQGNIDGIDEIKVTEETPIAGASEFHLIDKAMGNSAYASFRRLYWYQRFLNLTYFNAGVLVVNCKGLVKKAVERGYSDICSFYADRHRRYQIADQDCLNDLCPDQVTLPREFNGFPEISVWSQAPELIDVQEMTDAIRAAKVVHWVASNKPWGNPAENNHLDLDRCMFPVDRYHAVCESIKADLDDEFYLNVKSNFAVWKKGCDDNGILWD